MPRPKVFISYSSHEEDWARLFAHALKERGVRVWLDTDTDPGEPARDALETAFRESDVFVAIIGTSDPARPAWFFEWGAAILMKKKVVSIVQRDVDPRRLPFDPRRRAHLIKQTPEETADEFSHSLSAA